VMLQVGSPPAAEGRSPPPVRCTTLKKAVTGTALQLTLLGRSYILCPAVTVGS
jgi:hypothetical protein